MKIYLSEPTLVWSESDDDPVLHPLTEPMRTGSVRQLRVALEMSKQSGASTVMKIQAYYEFSNDGLTWSLPSTPSEPAPWGNGAFGPQLSGNGTAEGTTFDEVGDSGSDQDRWMRVGIKALNAVVDDTDINTAYVTLRVETDE